MKELMIKTENLSFSYSKKNKILNNVNINVPKGAIYGFLGPNGAGKSTTMQLLTGILVSDEKNIAVFGKEIQSQMPEMFYRMGALVESPSLYLHLSAIDNLRCITTLKNIDETKIPEVLELVGLRENGHQKVKKFSLGMKQRLAIGMTLLGDPELLLLDEPVNGLDPTGMTEVRELLVKLNKEKGITIFISSHLLDEIQKMCSHIGIIHKGEIKFEGTIDELSLLSNNCNVLVEIANSKEKIAIVVEKYPTTVLYGEHQLKISLPSKEEIPELTKFLIQQNISVYQLRIEDRLENWFLSLTK